MLCLSNVIFKADKIMDFHCVSKIDGHEWHEKTCLMGNYNLCGIGTLKVCTIEKILNVKTIQ
jgi:hypothetical protein